MSEQNVSNSSHREASPKNDIESRDYHPQETFPVRAFIDDLPIFFEHIPDQFKEILTVEAFEIFCARTAVKQIEEGAKKKQELFQSTVGSDESADKKDFSGSNTLLGEGSKTRQILEGKREPSVYVSLQFAAKYFSIGYKSLYNQVQNSFDAWGVERIGGTYRMPASALQFIASVGSLHTALDTWEDPELREVSGEEVERSESAIAKRTNVALMRMEYSNYPLLFASHAAPHQFPRMWAEFLEENRVDSHLCSFRFLLNRYVEEKRRQMGASEADSLADVMRQRWVLTMDQWKDRPSFQDVEQQPSIDSEKDQPDASEFSPHPSDKGVYLRDDGTRWATLSALQSMLHINYASVKEFVLSAGLTGVAVEPRNVVYSIEEAMQIQKINDKLKYPVDDPMAPSLVIDGKEYTTYRYLMDRFRITKETMSRLVAAAGADRTQIEVTFVLDNRRGYTPAYELELLRQNPRFVLFEQAAENSQKPSQDPTREWFFEIDGETYSTLPEIFRFLSGSSEEKVIDAWDKQFWSRVNESGETLESHVVLSRASAPLPGYRFKDVQRIMDGYEYKQRASES